MSHTLVSFSFPLVHATFPSFLDHTSTWHRATLHQPADSQYTLRGQSHAISAGSGFLVTNTCFCFWRWFDNSLTTMYRGAQHYDGGLTNFIPIPPNVQQGIRVCCFPSKQINSVYNIQISPDNFEDWPYTMKEVSLSPSSFPLSAAQNPDLDLRYYCVSKAVEYCLNLSLPFCMQFGQNHALDLLKKTTMQNHNLSLPQSLGTPN